MEPALAAVTLYAFLLHQAVLKTYPTGIGHSGPFCDCGMLFAVAVYLQEPTSRTKQV